MINVVADIGSPCLVPTVILNHSPNSLSILTAVCAFFAMLRISSINFLLTPYDFSLSHITSCLIISKAFCRSMKHWCFPFRLVFSFTSLSVVSVIHFLFSPFCHWHYCLSCFFYYAV